MTADEARDLLARSLAEWVDKKRERLVEVSQLTGQDENLYFFDASYQDKKSREECTVPYGVNKATGEILNCTVDS